MGQCRLNKWQYTWLTLKCQHFFDEGEDFLVTSADGLFDIDLRKAIESQIDSLNSELERSKAEYDKAYTSFNKEERETIYLLTNGYNKSFHYYDELHYQDNSVCMPHSLHSFY